MQHSTLRRTGTLRFCAARLWRTACCLLLCLPLWQCGGTPPDPLRTQPQWKYAPGSLELRYHADPQLNIYDEQGHTVVLCLYQLSDPNGFLNLAKSREGLLKLLDCKDFDATAVFYQRLIVQPGEDRVLPLDRAEKAAYVAVAAGYYDLNPQRSTRLFQIPVITRDEGIFTKDIVRKPGKLLVNLFLGPVGIQEIGSE